MTWTSSLPTLFPQRFPTFTKLTHPFFPTTTEILSCSLGIGKKMRLTISLMLSSLVLSQDENIEQLLWNGGKSLLEFDAGVVQKEAEFVGNVWNAGGEALDFLVNADGSTNGEAPNSLVHADGSKNVATGGSATDSTSEPVAGESAPQETAEFMSGSGNSVEPIYKLHLTSGSGPDSTVEPVTGKTVEPATDGENTVDQTNGLLEIPDEVTSKPPKNLLGNPTQPDKPPDLELSGIGDSVPVKTSLDHECDSTNFKASLQAILKRSRKMI